MFRQSYPQDGMQTDLNDDFRGVDKPNHGIHEGNSDQKYHDKSFKSLDACDLIEHQANKYR